MPKQESMEIQAMMTDDNEPANDGDENSDNLQNNQIVDMGSITTQGKYLIHCLTIIGQIEGHYILSSQNKTTKYEHVIPTLVAIEQREDIKGLIIILNTVGGDVEAGLAIAELISGMKKPTVSLVLGGGHSIGVPLAVSAKKSFIVPSATMTIHPVRMNGLVLGVPQTVSYFGRIQDRIVRFIIENSNIKESNFRSMLMKTDQLATDVGTILNGQEAVDSGLIDSIGGLSEAIEYLNQCIDEKEKKKKTQQPEMEKENENNQEEREASKNNSDTSHNN